MLSRRQLQGVVRFRPHSSFLFIIDDYTPTLSYYMPNLMIFLLLPLVITRTLPVNPLHQVCSSSTFGTFP